jgi:hypothetical protein|tara:strand:- start:81 stop:473 length:393 start_codon:yes stop_codon:yes gene_type:complete
VADWITDVGPPPGISVANGITDVVSPPGIVVGFKEVFVIRPSGAILTREGDDNVINGTSGFMVTKASSSQATIIEFTVPAAIGDFEFASFEGGGKHYDDGMKGLIKVFPKDLPPKGWAGDWRQTPDKCPS